MDGQRAQQNGDVRTELDLAIGSPGDNNNNLTLQDPGDVLDVQLGLGANTTMGNTSDASAAAADQDNNGGESHSARRTVARRSSNRHSTHQISELEAVFRRNPHPDEGERADLARRLGMTVLQVKFWFQNQRTFRKTLVQRQELEELKKMKGALQAERQALMSLTLNNACFTCGGPTVNETQLRLLAEIERLNHELQRANVGAGKALTTYHAHADPVMPVNERSQRETNTMLIDLAARALNESRKLVSAGTPMWLPTPDGEVEVLNLQRYMDTMLPGIFGSYRMGFAVDATRKAGDVMCTARNLVGIFMDVAHWSAVFPGIVASVDASHITPSASQEGMVLLMDAELRVLSPRVPVRKIKFVRLCQEVQPGKWAVVDVSVDGILGVPPTCIATTIRPSGCLIEERNTRCCKVTWITNMEYDESNVLPLYRPLLRSGQALGACRWLASLQRQCQFFAIYHTYTIPTIAADITPTVRKNIFEVAHRMKRSFYEAMFGPWSQPWRSVEEWRGDCGIGAERFKVVARMVTFFAGSGAPREQAGGVVLSATTPIWLPGIPPQKVFDYLCDRNRRGEWDSLANGAAILQEASFATGQLPGNAVSVLRTIVTDGTSGKLIMQEVCADKSCMVLAYSTVDEHSMQHAMSSGDHTSLYLLPSGLVILPDGASSIPAACSSSTAVSHKSNAGSFVSAIYQTQLNVQPTEKISLEAAHNKAGNLLCRAISKIKDAVHANSVVDA